MKELFIYLCLQLFDLVSSLIGISKGIIEMNPIFSVVGKISIIIVSMLIFYIALKKTPLTKYVVYSLNILLCLVIINNMRVIL